MRRPRRASGRGTSKLGLGREKIFEVRRHLQRRHLHRRVPDAGVHPRSTTVHLRVQPNDRQLRHRRPRLQGVKEKLLFQLTNFGQP